MTHKCAVLDCKHPPEVLEASAIAALAATTTAEAVLMTCLTASNVPKESRYEKMKGCLDKIEEQERAYGKPIKTQIHENVYHEARHWLLDG